jgi:hypothetical protein
VASQAYAPCSAFSKEPASRPSLLVATCFFFSLLRSTPCHRKRHSSDARVFPVIGGIKSTNLLRTLHGCTSPTGHTLHGIAVVSAIMASPDPRGAASSLAQTFRAWAAAASRGPTGFLVTPEQKAQYTPEGIAAAAAALVDTVRHLRPLVHQVFFINRSLLPYLFAVAAYAHPWG